MRQSIIVRVGLAAAITLLFTMAFLGMLHAASAAPATPQAAVSLSCAPSPPFSISRGMTETINWAINPTGNTPDYLDFKIYDPDNVVVDAATYTGAVALSVTRYYTVPASPKEGFYWARIKYFSIEAGQEAEASIKFYVAERGNLHVFKFEDSNGNHIQDPGEHGVPAVRIKLRTPFGDEVAKLTDATGWAIWDKVAIGTYIITETVPIGWEAILPATTTAAVHIDATTPITFANRQIGNLHVFKFEDLNGNGLRDAGENPVQGVTITVQAPLGALWSKTTGADGQANWNAIPIGSYRITETLPAGWTAVLPPAVSATVTGNTTANVTFANQLIANGCIIGKKIDDLHVGLPGWTIHARPRDAQQPVLTTVTNGSGDFYFAGLRGGWWTLWEEMQPGWAPVTPATFDVEVLVNSPCAEVRFKNRQACAQDPYEQDDTAVLAKPVLPNGIPQKHTLEPPSDLDWVAFDAVAGAIYTIRTDNLLGSTDTYLTLYDTNGTTLLDYSDDIVPSADPRSRIIWQAPAAGRYFARVRDFYQEGGRGCLAYDLILTVTYRNYLPLIIVTPEPPVPTPTHTPTLAPTQAPTPTRTPVPTRPTIVIPGLRHPKGIGVNLQTHRIYVASRDTHVVYEVNAAVAPAQVIRSIAVGHEPFGVAVNSQTNKVYVANFVSGSLSVINGATGTVLKTLSFAPYGEPTFVAINETTNRIYVPLHQGGRVAVINGLTDSLITTVETGAGAFGVAVDPTLNRVYVSCRDARIVRVLNGATNTLLWGQTIWPGGTPYALGIDPGLGQLYVSFSPEPDDPRQVLVYRIPAGGPSLLTAVLVGHGGADGGGGIAANPATHHVFVTNSQDDTVSVFDGVTNMLLDTVHVGDDPMGIAADPGWSYIWVGNRDSNTVSGLPDGY